MNTPTTTDAAIDLPMIIAAMRNWAGVADSCAVTEGHAPACIRTWADMLERLPTETPATAHGGSGIAIGTEIEGIPWTEEMERTYNKTLPKVRELVGLDQPAGGFVVVPREPTEAQWSGLARDVVMWMQAYQRHDSDSLLKHLDRCGTPIPEWLRKEADTGAHSLPKGSIASIIYKAMLDSAPTAQPSAKDGVRGGKWHGPTLDAVLRGLRSEDDSTQLRAIISSVETMREEATTAAGLVDAARAYMAAVDNLNAALNDGRNVHGALSGLIGTRDLLEAAIGREVVG